MGLEDKALVWMRMKKFCKNYCESAFCLCLSVPQSAFTHHVDDKLFRPAVLNRKRLPNKSEQ